MTKKINLIIFILAIAGLISECVALVPFDMLINKNIMYVLRSILGSVHLSFFTVNLFEHYNFTTGLELSYLNLILYVLLLFGGILFIRTEQKETRLVLFVMSVIFGSNVFYFFWNVVSRIVYFRYLGADQFWWLYMILFLAKNGVYAYFSFFVLKQIGPAGVSADQDLSEENKVEVPEDASRWKRLLHLFLDIYICFFIFSAMADVFSPWLLEPVARIMGERAAIWLLYFIASMIYFPLYEIVFGATPAKFLTSTLVVDRDGKKPSIKKIIRCV